MSEAKFTRGPWTWNGIWSISADHRPIALVHSAEEFPQEECIANAHLIAAATDLYEALDEVREWISNWSPNFEYDDDWPDSHKKMMGALAKARGEQ